MTLKRYLLAGAAALGVAAMAFAAPARAQQVTVDSDDIGGVVTGPKGPEAACG